MAARSRRPRFALDQGFPDSSLVRTPLPDLELVPLRVLHPDLTANHEDWQVLQQLRARGDVDGFVTLDAKMLRLEKEMVVLEQTRMTLVVLQDLDNDPFAAGALLVAISGRLARAFDRRQPQVFLVRLPRLVVEKPQRRLEAVSKQGGRTLSQMRKAGRLSPTELYSDCRTIDGTGSLLQ